MDHSTDSWDTIEPNICNAKPADHRKAEISILALEDPDHGNLLSVVKR